ncbi:MAG: riboflavin synthase [Bdellovibrionota bacterium]
MFSGIVEVSVPLLEKSDGPHEISIFIQRPPEFTDIKIGDSISVNGVCLTVEKFDDKKIKFTLGRETLKIIGPAENTFWTRPLNVERSLQIGQRLHGHFVLGHVDAVTKVLAVDNKTASWVIRLSIPDGYRPYVWKKGSITLNGVSLTVNDVEDQALEVCLIPETLSRTNLQFLKPGDTLTFEVDFFARGVIETMKNVKGNPWT